MVPMSTYYKLVTDYVCPTGSTCKVYLNLDLCKEALENAGCLLSKTCVVAKECIMANAKFFQLSEYGGSLQDERFWNAPKHAISVIKYLSPSERINNAMQAIIDNLPKVAAEFYKANAGVVNVAAATTLGIAIGYAYCRLTTPKLKTN